MNEKIHKTMVFILCGDTCSYIVVLCLLQNGTSLLVRVLVFKLIFNLQNAFLEKYHLSLVKTCSPRKFGRTLFFYIYECCPGELPSAFGKTFSPEKEEHL